MKETVQAKDAKLKELGYKEYLNQKIGDCFFPRNRRAELKILRQIRRRIMDYKNAGVDIEAGYKSVELMKKHVKETMRPEVLGGSWRICRSF